MSTETERRLAAGEAALLEVARKIVSLCRWDSGGFLDYDDTCSNEVNDIGDAIKLLIPFLTDPSPEAAMMLAASDVAEAALNSSGASLPEDACPICCERDECSAACPLAHYARCKTAVAAKGDDDPFVPVEQVNQWGQAAYYRAFGSNTPIGFKLGNVRVEFPDGDWDTVKLEREERDVTYRLQSVGSRYTVRNVIYGFHYVFAGLKTWVEISRVKIRKSDLLLDGAPRTFPWNVP